MNKRNIVASIISIFLVVSFIIIVYINNNHKTFKEDGITYALMVDGNNATSFPSKGMYQVDAECDGATGKWDYDNWKLYVENITGNISCDISFNSISKEYLNQKIIGMSLFSTYIPVQQNDYANVNNDEDYPWTWSDTNKTWTSSNKSATANSTTSTITFNPSTAGYYAICYTQSSQEDYDYGKIYKNGTEILSLIGRTITAAECLYLGNLTSSDAIKVTYEKDDWAYTGNDEVTFYMSSGTEPYTNQGNGQVVHENGYRYEGKNPNNFIWFNNELWRIIGVFDSTSHGQTGENLVKIIRENSLGGLAYDNYEGSSWNNSNLKDLLNGAYLNRQDGTNSRYCYGYSDSLQSNCDYTEIGIDSSYRSMIKNITWYVGAGSEFKVEDMYECERDTTSHGSSEVEGYIGLMYISDYGYSVLASSCARTTNFNDSYNTEQCAGQSWLYKGGNEWTLSDGYSGVYSLDYDGNPEYYSNDSRFGYEVRPVLYLDASVYVMDGDGSRLDPYIIGM